MFLIFQKTSNPTYPWQNSSKPFQTFQKRVFDSRAGLPPKKADGRLLDEVLRLVFGPWWQCTNDSSWYNVIIKQNIILLYFHSPWKLYINHLKTQVYLNLKFIRETSASWTKNSKQTTFIGPTKWMRLLRKKPKNTFTIWFLMYWPL